MKTETETRILLVASAIALGASLYITECSAEPPVDSMQYSRDDDARPRPRYRDYDSSVSIPVYRSGARSGWINPTEDGGVQYTPSYGTGSGNGTGYDSSYGGYGYDD